MHKHVYQDLPCIRISQNNPWFCPPEALWSFVLHLLSHVSLKLKKAPNTAVTHPGGKSASHLRWLVWECDDFGLPSQNVEPGCSWKEGCRFLSIPLRKSLHFIGKLHGNLRSFRKMMEILIFFGELELFRNQGSFLTISLAFHCTTKDLRRNIIESPNLSWYPQLNFTLP